MEKNRNKKILASVLLFSFCACGIFSSADPSKVKKVSGSKAKARFENLADWITNPESEYPSKLYITGVGSGPDDNSAEEDAKAELAKLFNQKIQSEENIKQYADATEDFTEYNSDINTTTRLESITGVKIEKKFYGEKVYALAVLKKQDAADYYSKQINSNDKKIQECLEIAEKFTGTLQSCYYAKKAYRLARQNDYYDYLITIIDAPFTESASFSYGSSIKLQERIAEYLKKVSVKIIVNGDDRNQVKEAFRKVMKNAGVLSTESNDAQYVLECNVSVVNTDLSDDKHQYVNYVLTANLKTLKYDQILDTYTDSGRAGHLSEQGAVNRAYINLVKNIEKSYDERFAGINEQN